MEKASSHVVYSRLILGCLILGCMLLIAIIVLTFISWHFYRIEKETLYKDNAYITVLYKPPVEIRSLIGHNLFAHSRHERYATIIIFPRGKRIIPGKEIYEEFLPWDGKKIHFYYREHPFRPISIQLAN